MLEDLDVSLEERSVRPLARKSGERLSFREISVRLAAAGHIGRGGIRRTGLRGTSVACTAIIQGFHHGNLGRTPNGGAWLMGFLCPHNRAKR
jgi:hypothetical protein